MKDNINIKDEAIAETALQLGLTYDEVESVIESGHEYLAKIISRGNLETMRFPYFGVFKPKPYRVWALSNPELAKLAKQRLINPRE